MAKWYILAPVKGGKYNEYVAISEVYFNENADAETVKQEVIKDGYDSNIRVKKA
jgi:hypothetical protein